MDYARSEVTIAVTKDVFTTRLERDKLPVKVVAYPFDFNGSAIKRFRQMRRFLRSLSADGVVFVQNNFLKFALPEFLAGWAVAKGNIYSFEALGSPQPQKPAGRMHLKVIPGMAFRWRIRMLALAARGWLCKRTLAVSEEVKERMVKWYHYPRKKIEVVCHGVDLSKYRPDAAVRKSMRRKFSIADSDFVVVSTARLCEQKCLHRLIDAFDSLCRDSEKNRLFLVGDGPLREQLENLAGRKTVADKIKFVGHQEDVSGFLKMSDIYVLPSDVEGIAGAAIEAMATGLIVVATKTPGPNEFIGDGVNGFLVERTSEGVLHGLEKALSLSDKLRREISDNARQTIEKNFEIEERTQKALGYMGLESVAAC